jgi:hypothetical protein
VDHRPDHLRQWRVHHSMIVSKTTPNNGLQRTHNLAAEPGRSASRLGINKKALSNTAAMYHSIV